MDSCRIADAVVKGDRRIYAKIGYGADAEIISNMDTNLLKDSSIFAKRSANSSVALENKAEP